MNGIEIREVQGKSALKRFVRFPFTLYKGNKYYVPPIVDFELSTLLPEKNPAFEHCQAAYFIAYQKDQVVGRIAAIIHGQELREKGLMRFGWIDFVDDRNVSKALIQTAMKWGNERGATGIHGPMGFTDLDFEGMLVDGFDKLASQATIYNYPYYSHHIEALGFHKAVDWIEGSGEVPQELPKRIKRAASMIQNRFGLRTVRAKSKKDLLTYAPGAFRVLNRSFENLYGFYPLSDRQIDYYVDQYFGFVQKDFVNVIANKEDEVVAFAITFPSLSRAFQKAKGRLFPFGFIPILRAMRKSELVDMLLIGVDPEYQKMGATQLIFSSLFDQYTRNGVKRASTAIMLEHNQSVINLWNEFEGNWSIDARRRCYIKSFDHD